MRGPKLSSKVAIVGTLISTPVAALSFSLDTSALIVAIRIIGTAIALAFALAAIHFHVNKSESQYGENREVSKISSIVLFIIGAPFAFIGIYMLYYAIVYSHRVQNPSAWLQIGAVALLVAAPFWFGAWWLERRRA